MTDGPRAWEGLLKRDGVRYEDYELAPRRRAQQRGILPNETTVKRLTNAINTELQDSEGQRQEFVQLVDTWWRDYGMNPYDASELPMADMTVVRVPLTKSRVDQAHGALFQALNLEPFAAADVDNGESGELAHHASLALSQQLRDAEFPNTLSSALLAAVVTGTGVLKDGVTDDVNGPRLAPDTLSIKDLILSPHAPRDLEQCTMIAHAYREPLRWVRDQAIAGLFDADAVKKVSPNTGWDVNDGGSVEREALHLPDADGWLHGETARVNLLEVYIRVRERETAETVLWRCICAREAGASVVVLRAEEWHDGFPFTLLRVTQTTNTVYGTGFPNVLKETQYAADMLQSAAMEADFASTAPYWEVDEMSSAGKLLQARAKQRGGAVRPRPGEIFWRRGTQEAVRPIHINPTPPAIDARLNRFEQYANTATIPVVPMQTYRSATEHRFAQANVSAKEGMMLGAIRADLSRFLTRNARLYLKYVAQPYSGETSIISHGSTGFLTRHLHWNALRWTPRGMTTQADQMLRMQATQEAMMIVDDYWQKLPMYKQLGDPAVSALYESRRMRLEALGVQEWTNLLGESPHRDPRVITDTPEAMQASQLLLGLGQGGQMPPMMGGPNPAALPGPGGQVTRESDGAPTVPPGLDMGGLN